MSEWGKKRRLVFKKNKLQNWRRIEVISVPNLSSNVGKKKKVGYKAMRRNS